MSLKYLTPCLSSLINGAQLHNQNNRLLLVMPIELSDQNQTEIADGGGGKKTKIVIQTRSVTSPLITSCNLPYSYIIWWVISILGSYEVEVLTGDGNGNFK